MPEKHVFWFLLLYQLPPRVPSLSSRELEPTSSEVLPEPESCPFTTRCRRLWYVCCFYLAVRLIVAYPSSFSSTVRKGLLRRSINAFGFYVFLSCPLLYSSFFPFNFVSSFRSLVPDRFLFRGGFYGVLFSDFFTSHPERAKRPKACGKLILLHLVTPNFLGPLHLLCISDYGRPKLFSTH